MGLDLGVRRRSQVSTHARRLGPCWQVEFQTSISLAALQKTGLRNPYTPVHRDCALFRENGKRIWGREHHQGSVLQVRNNF